MPQVCVGKLGRGCGFSRSRAVPPTSPLRGHGCTSCPLTRFDERPGLYTWPSPVASHPLSCRSLRREPAQVAGDWKPMLQLHGRFIAGRSLPQAEYHVLSHEPDLIAFSTSQPSLFWSTSSPRSRGPSFAHNPTSATSHLTSPKDPAGDPLRRLAIGRARVLDGIQSICPRGCRWQRSRLVADGRSARLRCE